MSSHAKATGVVPKYRQKTVSLDSCAQYVAVSDEVHHMYCALQYSDNDHNIMPFSYTVL